MIKVQARSSGMTHFALGQMTPDGKAQLACRGVMVLSTLAPSGMPLECKRCWAFNVKTPKRALQALGIPVFEYAHRLSNVMNLQDPLELRTYLESIDLV